MCPASNLCRVIQSLHDVRSKPPARSLRVALLLMGSLAAFAFSGLGAPSCESYRVIILGDVPGVIRTSHPPGSTHSSNLPLLVTLRHGTHAILASSLSLLLDGIDRTRDAEIASNGFGVTVELQPSLPRSSSHDYEIRFSTTAADSECFSYRADFSTDLRGEGDRFIEMEDYDYSRGRSHDKASEADYNGGGYAGDSGQPGVDYWSEPRADGLGNSYRPREDPEPDMLAGTDLERSGFLLEASWLLLGGSNDWFNYTRTFPAGVYHIHAALSSGSASPRAHFGTLRRRDNNATNPPGRFELLGQFLSEGSGAWGLNTLVPLTTDTGEKASVTIEGSTTFQYQFLGGAGDYLVFTPVAGFQLLRVSIEDGQLVIEWNGEATVMESSEVGWGYRPLSGEVRSPLRRPISGESRFFRLARVGAAEWD